MWNKVGKETAHLAPYDSDVTAPADIAASDALDNLLHAYREACPDPEPGVNFMPQLWAKIEARENSSNLFGRMAKALVTAALAASVILGLLMSISRQTSVNYNGTYLEALTADHASGLEPLNLDRISELEEQ
jgi:hypothetical protein